MTEVLANTVSTSATNGSNATNGTLHSEITAAQRVKKHSRDSMTDYLNSQNFNNENARSKMGGNEQHQQHFQHIMMGAGAPEHLQYQQYPASALATTSANSPKHQMRSPRCEAFVMTGEKMLNLNPKISPCYAKVCQNQLPPMVEVDSEEKKLSLSTTPKNRPFDEFPSMHKNARKRIQSAASANDEQQTTVVASLSTAESTRMPESRPEHTLETPNSFGSSNRKIQKPEGQSLATADSFDSSGGTNIVPADPSNQPQHYESSISTLPEHLPTRTDAHGLPLLDEPPLNKATNISRFMASSHSQSTPASPARGFQQQQQQQTHLEEQHNHHNKHASNRSSSDAIAIMQSAYSPETIARLARHLFTNQEGIKIAAFLVKSDDLSLQIANEFVRLFNFAGFRVDAALRAFLSHVCLTGETIDRAQLLSHFAQRYHECNPTVFNGVDEIHALTCALLLLNTDLHGKNNKKMTCREFIDNLLHTDFKYDLAMLKELYISVKEQSFQYKPGEEPIQPSPLTVGMGREKRLSRMLSKRGNPDGAKTSVSSTSALIDPEQQIDYKHGWLVKKSIYDADGKKTPLGRRKWQMLYATIRGMVLYLHQNENSFSSGRYITFRNCILLHHSMAEIPRDYTKRKNVFRLRTANLGEFLLQTSDSTEVQKWIDAINYVAAAFSTPALPTPVGANGIVAFYKPHLPSAPTHLSVPDQLRAHEQRLVETTENLARLRENAPSIKAKGKVVYDYFYKERFLDKERERYTIYVAILREKLARAASTLRCNSQSTNTLVGASKNAVNSQRNQLNGATAGTTVNTPNGTTTNHHQFPPQPRRTSSSHNAGDVAARATVYDDDDTIKSANTITNCDIPEQHHQQIKANH